MPLSQDYPCLEIHVSWTGAVPNQSDFHSELIIRRSSLPSYADRDVKYHNSNVLNSIGNTFSHKTVFLIENYQAGESLSFLQRGTTGASVNTSSVLTFWVKELN